MFTVVNESADYILINKDPAVSFHKEVGFVGLPALLREKLGLSQIFPIHRLDKMTSGLLLFAKSKEVAQILGEEFSCGRVEKYYLALSDRRPKKKQGLLKGDMVRSRRGTWKLLRSMANPASTRFVSKPLGNGLRLFLLKPLTGKTHQLRVALKSIGAPALGDNRYHPGGNEELHPDRGYLHAFSLSFQLAGLKHRFLSPPLQGKYFLDAPFLEILSSLQEPWEFFPKKQTTCSSNNQSNNLHE